MASNHSSLEDLTNRSTHAFPSPNHGTIYASSSTLSSTSGRSSPTNDSDSSGSPTRAGDDGTGSESSSSEADDGESRGLLDVVAQSQRSRVSTIADPFQSPEDQRKAAAAVAEAFEKLHASAQQHQRANDQSLKPSIFATQYSSTSSSGSDSITGTESPPAGQCGPRLPYNYAYRRKSLVSLSHRSYTKPLKKKSQSKKLTLLALCCVNLTAYLTMSIIAPFFPYEAEIKGMSSTSSGLVFSIYALVMMISSPLLGKLMPVVGVKFLLMSGIWFAGWSNILFGVLEFVDDQLTFAILCFVIRSICAFGAASFSTASYTYIIQLFPENVGLAFGLTETMVGVGMSLGPAIGGFLYSAGGYGLPFYVLGSFVLLNLPICWLLVKPLDKEKFERRKTKITESAQSGHYQGASYWKMAKKPSVWVISLVLTTSTSTQGYLDPTVEPHFRQYGLTPNFVGLIFLVMSAAYALSSPLIGWLASKLQDRSVMMAAGLVFIGFGFILIGPSWIFGIEPSMWLGTGAMLIIGFADSLAFVPTFEALLDIVTLDASDDVLTYSLVSGWWSCFNNLGEFAGSALGGLFLDVLGYDLGAIVMASWTIGVSVVLSGFYLTGLCRHRLQERRWLRGLASSKPEADHEASPLIAEKNEKNGNTYHYHHYADICRGSNGKDGLDLGRLEAFRQKETTTLRNKGFPLTL